MKEPTLSDEVLMAYADGELLEPEATAMREGAARDPAIAGRIAMFSASRKMLSEVFEPILDAPVPQRLHDAVKALGSTDFTVSADPRRRRTTGQRRWSGMGSALLRGWQQHAMLASAAACFLGVGVGWWLGASNWGQESPGSLATQVASMPGTVTDALDRLPSGERASARLDGLGVAEVLPLASYESGASLCREFEISRSSTEGPQAVRGVVCRSDGRWLLKALADLTTRKAQSDVYQPASGGEDLAAVLGLGQSLSQQQERQFLDNGWRHR